MSPVALLFAAAVVAGDPATGSAAEAPKLPRVALETLKGTIVLELDAARAPKSVENFLAYVDAGHYDGTVFHRVIDGFMVQGGGFTAEMTQKPTRPPVENEADNGLKNKRGTVAMARTMDPHSASAQFFVNTVDNDFLDHRSKDARGWGYAVFGRVVEGMEVVDAITKVATANRGPFENVPVEPVMIQKATRLP
jgi:peptidyl-prolyl cis-trans isomerase B (cyclophilin B)